MSLRPRSTLLLIQDVHLSIQSKYSWSRIAIAKLTEKFEHSWFSFSLINFWSTIKSRVSTVKKMNNINKLSNWYIISSLISSLIYKNLSRRDLKGFQLRELYWIYISNQDENITFHWLYTKNDKRERICPQRKMWQKSQKNLCSIYP